MRSGDLRSVAAVFASAPEAHIALLRAVWPAVVGPQVARQAEVASLTGDLLRIRVADPRWRKALPRMRRQMLDNLRAAVGNLAPRRIGFLEGQWSPAPASDPQEVPPAGASVQAADLGQAALPRAVAVAAELIADPILRDEFVQTAARYLAGARAGSQRRGV